MKSIVDVPAEDGQIVANTYLSRITNASKNRPFLSPDKFTQSHRPGTTMLIDNPILSEEPDLSKINKSASRKYEDKSTSSRNAQQ